MEEKVVKASLATYFHGITEEISLAEVGPDGLPVLRKLLADRTFPRRDNGGCLILVVDRGALIRARSSGSSPATKVPEPCLVVT